MEDLGQLWPTGVRFHPTDEELVMSFLKKKTCAFNLDSDFLSEIDVYNFHPEELPGLSKLKTGDRQWFFFSPRDLTYRSKAKTNRTTKHGSWKSTGKIVTVTSKSRNVGNRRTLVFYKICGSKRERTDWVMYEYTMSEDELSRCSNVQGYYSIYKVKKKSGRGPKNGEQYGAEVNEEDTVVNESADQVGDPGEQVNTVTAVNLQDHSLLSLVEPLDSEQKSSKALDEFDLVESVNSQRSTFETNEAKSAPNSWFDDLNASMHELDCRHDLFMFIAHELGISLGDLGPIEDETV